MTALYPPDFHSLTTGTWGTDADREETTTRTGLYSVKFLDTSIQTKLQQGHIPVEPEFCAYAVKGILQQSAIGGTQKINIGVDCYQYDKTAASTATITPVSSVQPTAINTWEPFAGVITGVSSDTAYMRPYLEKAGAVSGYTVTIAELKLIKVPPWFRTLDAGTAVAAGGWQTMNMTSQSIGAGCSIDYTTNEDVTFLARRGILSCYANILVESLADGGYIQLRIKRGTANYTYSPKYYNNTGGADDTWAQVSLCNYSGSTSNDPLTLEIYNGTASPITTTASSDSNGTGFFGKLHLT